MVDTCTWTKVDAIVSLRVQLGHLDALRTQEKVQNRLKSDDGANRDPGQAKEAKAYDVNLAIKDTDEPETSELHYGGIPETLKLLQSMASEPWQRLDWIDQAVSKPPVLQSF